MQDVLTKFILYFAISMQGACSLHYMGDDGYEYHVGFMMMRSHNDLNTTTTSSQTLGLTIDLTSDSGGLNVGYRNLSKTKIYPETVAVIETVSGSSHEVKQYETARPEDHANGESLPSMRVPFDSTHQP